MKVRTVSKPITPRRVSTTAPRVGTASAAFGSLLRAHRADAGLSQAELAARAGCVQTAVGLLEGGRRNSSCRVVLALAAALGLDASQTDRLLYAAGLAPRTDYQALYEAEHGPIDAQTKWCPRCQQELPAGPRGRFSRDRARPDGLHPICKACESARNADYRKRAALGRSA